MTRNADVADLFRDRYCNPPIRCPDPETCTELHNEADPLTGEEHHYGCECGWCVLTH